MSRKDTIMITVLINLGVLAVLFATAVIYDDDDKTIDGRADVEKSLAAAPAPAPKPLPVVEKVKIAEASPIAVETPTDEVDHMLNTYVNGDGQEISIFEEGIHEHLGFDKDEVVPVAAAPEPAPAPTPAGYAEVTVKRGDALEKIARANNTTVAAIIKENNLRNERLSVGQVLRIPIGKKKDTAKVAAAAPKSQPASSEKQYYIVKSGDSPWKIAKQHNVKFEDLLKLNNLDEEKAKNLKIGDKLRVK